MYKYSPIKSIYIKDFRNLGNVQLDFDESPIISLVGDNESGKTSVVKAFGVCALHANPREQKNYIRDGSNGFGVAIELEDGTLISRVKTATFNQYSVKDTNGETWSTNKIDAGLPIQVQELMGLIEETETKEFLQIRTYEDQLLFVITPASTNYKVMYDALKVDQLTRAIKLGSTESNKLKSEILDNETSIRALSSNIKSLKFYDLEPVVNIKNRLIEQIKPLELLDRAKRVLDNINKAKEHLGALNLIEENKLEEISLLEANSLSSVYRIVNNKDRIDKELEVLKKSETLENIDLTLISSINKAIDIKTKLDNIKLKSESLSVLESLDTIGGYEVNQLARGKQIIDTLNNQRKQYDKLYNTELKSIDKEDIDVINKIIKINYFIDRNSLLVAEERKSTDYVEQVENYLKYYGVSVINCPKCGESIVTDQTQHIHN